MTATERNLIVLIFASAMLFAAWRDMWSVIVVGAIGIVVAVLLNDPLDR